MLTAILRVREELSNTRALLYHGCQGYVPFRTGVPLLQPATSASCVVSGGVPTHPYIILFLPLLSWSRCSHLLLKLKKWGQAKLSDCLDFQGQPCLHWRNWELSCCGQAGLVCLFYYFFFFFNWRLSPTVSSRLLDKKQTSVFFSKGLFWQSVTEKRSFQWGFQVHIWRGL